MYWPRSWNEHDLDPRDTNDDLPFRFRRFRFPVAKVPFVNGLTARVWKNDIDIVKAYRGGRGIFTFISPPSNKSAGIKLFTGNAVRDDQLVSIKKKTNVQTFPFDEILVNRFRRELPEETTVFLVRFPAVFRRRTPYSSNNGRKIRTRGRRRRRDGFFDRERTGKKERKKSSGACERTRLLPYVGGIIYARRPRVIIFQEKKREWKNSFRCRRRRRPRHPGELVYTRRDTRIRVSRVGVPV